MSARNTALAFWLARDARSTANAIDLGSASLRELAARRMRALLVDARRTPYYAARIRDAGLTRPEALRDVELPLALQSLAPVTKAELLDAGDTVLRDGGASSAWFSSRSSGSTGEPFRVWYDARAWSMLKYLVKMRSRRAAGMHVTDRIAILDAIAPADEGKSPLERAGRLRRISVFREPTELAAALASFQPAGIYALPSALLEVARACDAGAPRVRARHIFTSGELLSTAARRTITNAFGAKLSDVYGTSETKEISWECAHGSRHINADVVHIEILDENGAVSPAGTDGEIVATLLMNRAMPLIRYRTGDRGSLSPKRCACGRESPLLGLVRGREADMLELPDGSILSPYLLTTALEAIAGLAQYQVVQRERGLLQVNVIATNSHDSESLERSILDALRDELPPDVRIEVGIVDRLPQGARAKVRVVAPLPRSQRSLALACEESAP